MIRIIFLSVIATALFPPPGLVWSAPAKGSLKKGAQIYVQRCARCHGLDGVGEDPKNTYGGWKKNGQRIAPALNGTAHSWNHSIRDLTSIIKKGSIDRKSSMRSHQEELSDAGIASVILYIKSLWPEEIRKKHEELYGSGRETGDSP